MNRPFVRNSLSFVQEVWRCWGEDRAWMLAAAISFFTIFSLTPLLIIAVAVGGFVFGEEASRQEIMVRVNEFAGQNAADAVGQVLQNISDPRSTLTAGLVGFGIILAGASGVFWQLRIALNVIWRVQPKQRTPRRSIIAIIRSRALTLCLALGTGLVVIISLLTGPLVSATIGFLAAWLPNFSILWRLLEISATFIGTALLFTAIFEYVPEHHIPWRHAFVGGLFTAFLFNIGRIAIGVYLSETTVGSAYGAAGSLVVFLIWIYYSAQILLLGGEFTCVYNRKRAHRRS